MAVCLLKNLIHREGLESLIDVESAGTWALEGSPATEYSQKVCAEHGMDISSHRSQPVSLHLVQNADLVLCMATHHKTDLQNVFPHFAEKIFTIKEFARMSPPENNTIDDPIGRSLQVYRKTFKTIEQEVERIWPVILSMALSKIKDTMS